MEFSQVQLSNFWFIRQDKTISKFFISLVGIHFRNFQQSSSKIMGCIYGFWWYVNISMEHRLQLFQN